MSDIAERITRTVLLVHRFNGGKLSHLNLSYRLQEPVLFLDASDVAQVIAAIEEAFGCSLQRYRKRLETWHDLVEQVDKLRNSNAGGRKIREIAPAG